MAFLISYAIAKKFKVGGVSFALVMLLACLPDIDILLQSAGITSHKTYTHSFILSMMVVPAVIFAITKWRKEVSYAAASVYSLAYIQHIVIGDIVIGGTNILYPFGNMMVGTGVGYGTLTHQALEFLLLAAAASIVVAKSFGGQLRDLMLFRWNITDKLCYALLIGSLVISFAYLLYGVKVLPRLFIETDLELALFLLLHLSTIALISFLIVVAKQHSVFVARNTALSRKND